jgi:hypothetical protein
MTYRTRPYVPGTLFVPNPAKSYEIDGQHLTGRTLGSVFAQVALPPASVTRAPGAVQAILHTAFNAGDVVVADHGGAKHTFPRIMDVRAFRAALSGIAAPKTSEPNSKELENFEICLPPVPPRIYELIMSMKGGHHSNYPIPVVHTGDWVEKNDPIAYYGDVPENTLVGIFRSSFIDTNPDNKTHIVSPVSGKITMMGENRLNVAEVGLPDEYKFFAKIRPVKGTDFSEAARKAYVRKAYEFIINYALDFVYNSKRLEGRVQNPRAYAKLLEEDVRSLQQAEIIIQPIEPSTPSFSPSAP